MEQENPAHAAPIGQFPASISKELTSKAIPKVSLAQQGPGGAASLFHKGTPQFQTPQDRISPTARCTQRAAQQPREQSFLG